MSDFMLYDMQGNPIPSKELKERAAQQLKEYIVKYKQRFQDWFTMYGANKRPPIFYDTKTQEWVWVED